MTPTLRSLLLALALLSPGCRRAIPLDVEVPGPRTLTNLPVLSLCFAQSNVELQGRGSALAGFPLGYWRSTIGTIVIRHPSGLIAIDPSTGKNIRGEIDKAPLWFRSLFGGSAYVPTATALEEAGIAPDSIADVLITHSHWDHLGGAVDLPNARVRLTQAEVDWVKSLDGYVAHGAFPHHFAAVKGRVLPFTFDGPPYEGFSASHDLLGDGSLVAVPFPGHTPGSAAYFVNSGDGKRFLFIGDGTWSMEGVTRPSHKSWSASFFFDDSADTLAASIGIAHAIALRRPDIQVIPSHDLQTMEKLPRCAKRQ